MKYNSIIQFLIFLCIISQVSCDKILEENLEEETLVLISPTDSLISPIQTITFWWEPLEGALNYNIQIVSPSFDQPDFLIVTDDTEFNTYTATLQEGCYSWRVIGQNTFTNSLFQTRSLCVQPDSSLTLQTVNLLLPADGIFTNTNSINFQWQPLAGAETYFFELAKPDFSSGGLLIESSLLTTISHQITLTDEGQYTWRVKAENTNNETPFSSRQLVLDTTSPLPPFLLSPIDSAMFTLNDLPVTISWQPDTDSVMDSLFIYNDQGLTNLVLSEGIEANTFDFGNQPVGSYYWHLKSEDEAGNVSGLSETRIFTLNQ